MTKHVRIENADTSNHKIRVTVQYLDNGVWVDAPAETDVLDLPTQMCTKTVWKTKRLIIEEID